MIVIHKNLGPVKITETTQLLQKNNGDPSSLFVEYNREILEVSRAMIKEEALQEKNENSK